MPPTDTVRRLRAGQPITEGWTGDVVDALARQHTGGNVYIDGIGVFHRPDPRTASHPKVELIQIQPDEDKRYGTANARGVLDGKIVTLTPPDSGDVREAALDQGDSCWVWPLRHRPEALATITYSASTGTFTAGEHVTQENTGASGFVFRQDTANTKLYVHVEEGSVPFETHATERTITGDDSGATAEPSAVSTPQGTLDEEKVDLLPAWDVYKALYVGILDVSGDERPLYAIDEEPKVRQFELKEDYIQNDPDAGTDPELWPNSVLATLIDEPGQPSITLYMPGEWETETPSAYYPGIGRVGAPGHKGSFGVCRWNEVRKRWELIDGLFATIALGVTEEIITAGNRGDVTIWWKDLGAVYAGLEASSMRVAALNWNTEKIELGSKVVMIFNRQENLWMIVYVDRPVMLASDEGYLEPIGKIEFDVDEEQIDYITAYPFKLTEQGTGHVLVEQLGPPELTVQETDGNPNVFPCRVLRFNANDFVVVDGGNKSATVSLRDELEFGEMGQLTIGWDGTDGAFTLTSGAFYFSGGDFGIFTNAPYEGFHLKDDTLAVQNSAMGTSSAVPAISVASVDGEIRGYTNSQVSDGGFLRMSAGGGTNLNQRTWIDLGGFTTVSADNKIIRLGTAGTVRLQIDRLGHHWLPADGQEIRLGATVGGDAQIQYDGADLIINVDTGNFLITGGALIAGDGGTTNYTSIDATGDVNFVGGAGLAYGEVSGYDVAATITISGTGIANKVQITSFDTDGPSNDTTPAHGTDDVTITNAGRYLVTVSTTISSAGGGGADTIGLAVYVNNGATLQSNCHAHRKLAGGGGDIGSVSISGICTFAASDTVELWIWNEDSTDDVVVDDCTLSVVQIGGTP